MASMLAAGVPVVSVESLPAMEKRWGPGDVILEEGWNAVGMLVALRAETVVEDSPRLLALFSAAGATYWNGDPTPGARRYEKSLQKRLEVFLSREPMTYEERTNRSNVLLLRQPGAAYSIWLSWDGEWRFQGWYVNLEAPYRRTPAGIAVTDYYLDIVVSPDLAWRWKDEDEFEAMFRAGVLTDAQRQAIRAEAEAVAGRIEARSWPFSEGWPDWRPDPAWLVPKASDYWTPPRG
jgi:hypothetical protein